MEWTEEGLERWKQDKAAKRKFLDVKNDTERLVKYILCDSPLIGAVLRKDGDWATIAGGATIWQKKVADYSGGVPDMHGNYLHTYVEVKGVSPGNNFQLSRLDKSNNPRQPSQHEKLTLADEVGHLVWLALGFWDTLYHAKPLYEERKGRKYKRWLKKDVAMTLYLIPWEAWLDDILPGLKRSLRQKDRERIESASIRKIRNRWQLHPEHWLHHVPK